MSKFIESQNWRYATKQYDASKKISQQDLATLTDAIQLSVSSYGLQPYKVLVIEDLEIRNKLKEVAFNQSQITDASQLIVFATINDVGDNEIDSFVKNIADTREIPLESVEGYGSYMKSIINGLTPEQKQIWASKQTYLALGNLLNAAADLKIDATPMEGFIATSFDEILDLKKLNLSTSVIATIGYRHEDDQMQHFKKVRKSKEELFIQL